MNFARVIANDMELSTAGDLLADTTPDALPRLNLAFREFLDECAANGVEDVYDQVDCLSLPPNGSQDPASETCLNWVGFFDGNTTTWPVPVLPPDLIIPVRVWYRQSGQNEQYVEIQPSNDGLPSVSAQQCLGEWEWRTDGLYTNGSTVAIDMRIRYLRYIQDFVLISGEFPASAQVPIMRCAQALAYYIVATFAGGRGSDYYGTLIGKGKEAIQKLLVRTARKKQRGNHRKRPYSWGSQYGILGW